MNLQSAASDRTLDSDGAAAVAARPTCDVGLSPLERAVLLTVLYADLFDFPLTEDELFQRLVLHRTDRRTVQMSTASLTGRYLSVSDGLVTWSGREYLADVRRRRSRASALIWRSAERYADWLYRVPFIRSVAVSGSLAVGNAEPDGDVDLFCIVESKRLWVARLFIVPMSKLSRAFLHLFSRYLCPNYLVTVDALEMDDRNLFTAHEIVQAVPLRGAGTHAAFLRSNGWVAAFLPHHQEPEAIPDYAPPPVFKRHFERLLKGRLGDILDRVVHTLFSSFYRRRAAHRGWSWTRLASAYRRDRYTVPEGGYVRVVRRLFEDRVSTRLEHARPHGDLRRLFPSPADEHVPTCYDWEDLFRREYGSPAGGDGANPFQSPPSS